jgi:hypothetical protein
MLVLGAAGVLAGGLVHLAAGGRAVLLMLMGSLLLAFGIFSLVSFFRSPTSIRVEIDRPKGTLEARVMRFFVPGARTTHALDGVRAIEIEWGELRDFTLKSYQPGKLAARLVLVREDRSRTPIVEALCRGRDCHLRAAVALRRALELAPGEAADDDPEAARRGPGPR